MAIERFVFELSTEGEDAPRLKYVEELIKKEGEPGKGAGIRAFRALVDRDMVGRDQAKKGSQKAI